MKVAIIGSRKLNIDISQYLPSGITLIISGGAKGIDWIAEKYANDNQIPKLILRPDYSHYGKCAPIKRNEQIVESADLIIAFWDGLSCGTKYTIDYASKKDKQIIIHII